LRSTLFPYTTLFRSTRKLFRYSRRLSNHGEAFLEPQPSEADFSRLVTLGHIYRKSRNAPVGFEGTQSRHLYSRRALHTSGRHLRSEEHTSELQSPDH